MSVCSFAHGIAILCRGYDLQGLGVRMRRACQHDGIVDLEMVQLGVHDVPEGVRKLGIDMSTP
jgi:hypothetical protein